MTDQSTLPVHAQLRRCGRCRGSFPAAPTPLAALAEWWICTDCRAMLLPGTLDPDETSS